MTQVTAHKAIDGRLFEKEEDMVQHNASIEFKAEVKELAADLLQQAPYSDDWRCKALAEEADTEAALAWLIAHKPETLKNAIRLAESLRKN